MSGPGAGRVASWRGTRGAAWRLGLERPPGAKEGWLDSIGVNLTELEPTRKTKTRSCRFRFIATGKNLVKEKRIFDALGSQYQFDFYEMKQEYTLKCTDQSVQ